jgi:hypothetical protein
MNNKTFFRKIFFTAYTNNKQRSVIIYADEIRKAHAKAREFFGKGVSFSVRESTHEETLHADPVEVLRT